jgi:hypothetical protein
MEKVVADAFREANERGREALEPLEEYEIDGILNELRTNQEGPIGDFGDAADALYRALIELRARRSR